MVTFIIGVKMNGTNKTGFNTIGNPKSNGSLILKIPGAADNFPTVLYCLFFLANMKIAIISAIVVPEPPPY